MIADIWPTSHVGYVGIAHDVGRPSDPAAPTDRWEWVVLIMISWLRGETGNAVGVPDGF